MPLVRTTLIMVFHAKTPCIVKGKAGSPYAITDYYDIDPDIADNVSERMNEFEDLVKRTHKEGLKGDYRFCS